MNKDKNFLNTILENRIQCDIIRIVPHDQVGLILGTQACSVFKN